MSRRQACKVFAVAAVLGVVGFAWGRGGVEQATAQPTVFPDLWQWDLTRSPPPAGADSLRLVLRSRPVPAGDSASLDAVAALRAGAGTDRSLGSDMIMDEVPDDGRLALQLIDLRQLGAAADGDDAPLRLHGVLRLYGSGQKVTARLAGHSVRGRPTAHTAGWVNGERPLLSFATAGIDGHMAYTVLLSTRPDYD